MSDDEFLTEVMKRIEDEALSQVEVASACDISQPHLSKVLNKRVKLARKTRAALRAWMGMEAPTGAGGDTADWDAVVTRLRSRDPERARRIMQLLQIIEALTA